MGPFKPRRLSDAKDPFNRADKKASSNMNCWFDERCGGRLTKIEITYKCKKNPAALSSLGCKPPSPIERENDVSETLNLLGGPIVTQC